MDEIMRYMCKPKEERNAFFDISVFNEICFAYKAATMNVMGFDREKNDEEMDTMNQSFNEMDAVTAREALRTGAF